MLLARSYERPLVSEWETIGFLCRKPMVSAQETVGFLLGSHQETDDF